MAVVNAGLNQIAQLIMDDVSHQAIGTGTASVMGTDTALAAEHDRNATTKETRNGANLEIRTFFSNSELPSQIEEVGLFNAASGGTMYTRRLFQYAKQASRDLLLAQFLRVQEGT